MEMIKPNKYSDEALGTIMELINTLADRGFDTTISMRIIVTILTVLVDTEDKLTWLVKTIADEHNARSLALIPVESENIH